jgi:hypothetical protein
MPAPLRLTLTDYRDATRWRWVLSDSRGGAPAEHVVQLDPTSREYGGFLDLRTYLDYNAPIHKPKEQLEELGAWIGETVFGELRTALWARRSLPAVAVEVVVPEAARDLLARPFELARFADGTSFREAGLRFVYGLDDRTAAAPVAKEPAEKALRILAAFSLPVHGNPLNLRRERYGLQRLVRDLNQTHGLALELRVLQYGATRDTLREALEEGDGWDIIHLSGHGQKGELLLENDRGGSDIIKADELGALLELSRARLKLLILDSSYSGVGGQAAAREQVGLEPMRQEGVERTAPAETTGTALPNLALVLSQRLDCAAVAMRYPVGDAFVTELMLALYQKLLEKRRPLPAALHLALDEALAADIPRPPLSSATPILVGLRAANLQLAPPLGQAQRVGLPRVGLSIGFPPEPERFVGRLQPMLRASQALAWHSAKRGVLFFGMPGAGKTACALELAYRHEYGRFLGYVWHRAPEAGSDISNALFNLMQDIQVQLNAPMLGLTTALDDPRQFRQYTLPRLRALLKQNSLLIVLDNLETLLTASDRWRDPLWGEVVAVLLALDGPSRVVLTSRRVPAELANHPKLQVEAIHALSFAESVLLARELPNLRRLFHDEDGLKLLQQTLGVVQGHPKLLELADGLAADRAALAARVAAAADELADRADVLDAFFVVGGAREGETRQQDADLVRSLEGWTAGVARDLTPTASLLFAFLSRLEPEDRRQDIVEANWRDFLMRLGAGHAAAAAALAEPGQGLPAALAALEAAGLLSVERPVIDAEQIEALKALLATQPDAGSGLDAAAFPRRLAALTAQYKSYAIQPSVAETVRGEAESDVLDAADVMIADYHIAVVWRGLKSEMEGGGWLVVDSARRAAAYLLRQRRWEVASALLEEMLQRDRSPESLAFALPLLRRIVEATSGTDLGLENAGVLAKTLSWSGRSDEADPLLRDLVARGTAEGKYQLALAAAGELCNLLQRNGRLVEALKVAEGLAEYTAQAGMGPWTRVSAEATRLQVLANMGRLDEVLAEVESLLPMMNTLPLDSDTDEAVSPWNVRETVLNTGMRAALYAERWETALAFNVEVANDKRRRGADGLELAGTRFNDYGPLLRLGRHDEARALLLNCRAMFEEERDIVRLGNVYGALADLEDKTGGRTAAVRFQEVALGYKYQTGEAEGCAASHHNLANYLARQGADEATVLAHRLAAAAIYLQMASGLLPTVIHTLANSELPPSPPAFDEVVHSVEAIEGVNLRALFGRLPRTAPDGDIAIAAAWQMAAFEKNRQVESARKPDPALAVEFGDSLVAFESETVGRNIARFQEIDRRNRLAKARNWPVVIETLLGQKGNVSLSDLPAGRETEGLAALINFTETHPELDLEWSEQGLSFRRSSSLEELHRLWNRSQTSMKGERDLAENLVALARCLCSATGFTLADEIPRQVGNDRFLALSLDVGSTFSDIRVSPRFPLLFFRGKDLRSSDVSDLRYAVDEVSNGPRTIVLLASFAEGERLEEARRVTQQLRRVFASEAVVLSEQDIREFLIRTDPRQVLRRRLLAEISLLSVSPFITDGPTPDHMFFGREVELAEIQQQAGTASFALFGGRKVGKTSILQRLERVRLPQAGYKPFSFSCQRIDPAEPAKADFLAAVARTWTPRGSAMSSFAELVEQIPRRERLVFLIDEVDKLVPADRRAGWPLFGELRALAHAGTCQFVFAGESFLREALIEDSASPLFNFAKVKRIACLDAQSVNELVCGPFRQLEIVLVEERAVVTRIFDATGGHPNVVQRLCQKLIEMLNQQGPTRRITRADVNAVLANPRFQEDDYLNIFWDRATLLERILTLLLVQEPKPRSLNQIRKMLGDRLRLVPSGRQVAAALRRLVDLRSILVRTDQGYTFAIRAFPEVLARTVTAEDSLEELVEEYQEQGDSVAS